ncbi:MAG: putative toxin-antitoxin system toxin component, PIN family [Chloroflexota bacterium]|nr:putative toxin-antitoxin system toxin component, PIN family [Chloroflexota bacterium]
MLDTNVLVSGVAGFAAAEGVPGRLLHLWRDRRFELIVSAEILAEVQRTLAKPYYRQRLTLEEREDFRLLLQTAATNTLLTARVFSVATHSEDDLVLDAAVSGQADYLVTGDKQVQRLEAIQGVRIVSPRYFLTRLEQEGAAG